MDKNSVNFFDDTVADIDRHEEYKMMYIDLLKKEQEEHEESLERYKKVVNDNNNQIKT